MPVDRELCAGCGHHSHFPGGRCYASLPASPEEPKRLVLCPCEVFERPEPEA